ncbi:MAG: electron transfer flavoprotein subunit alpha/FixB family protein [Proteobacteria bacterium]|nr:electron transfer flavoprotein subunit alpha/FixB family protein [Pseudomonadota bacterium]
MAGIWVLAETRGQTLELLGIGRRLADDMGTQLAALLCQDRELSRDYIARGADEVLILPPLPEGQPLEAYVPVIADEAKKEQPALFLIGGTSRGKDLAARIATRLDAGLCTSCIALRYETQQGEILMERLAYGGAAAQSVRCLTRPAMATVPPRTFDPAPARDGREGAVRELPAPAPSPVRVIERKTHAREAKDLAEANVIVGVGRGFEKREDLSLARELADVLGAEIGCTRPISEEMHWLHEDRCIGLSGAVVKPDLYMGLGVSGQIQHVTGIRNAKVIAAVDRDESAPIFGVADLGIVGDLYDVVPTLLRELSNKPRS